MLFAAITDGPVHLSALDGLSASLLTMALVISTSIWPELYHSNIGSGGGSVVMMLVVTVRVGYGIGYGGVSGGCGCSVWWLF